MDLSSIIITLITGLGNVGPVTYLSLIVACGVGYFWFTDRRAHENQIKDSRAEFTGMVHEKDRRYDALAASMQTAIDAANQQLATLNKDYSAANKDTAEIVQQVAQTLATLASNLRNGKGA